MAEPLLRPLTQRERLETVDIQNVAALAFFDLLSTMLRSLHTRHRQCVEFNDLYKKFATYGAADHGVVTYKFGQYLFLYRNQIKDRDERTFLEADSRRMITDARATIAKLNKSVQQIPDADDVERFCVLVEQMRRVWQTYNTAERETAWQQLHEMCRHYARYEQAEKKLNPPPPETNQ